MEKYYAVVTFGTPPKKKVFDSLETAQRVAVGQVGIGSCSCARVYECDSRAIAKTADISEVRQGERIVYA